ncbi:MAG: endopeptidase La [Elusimicrobia bacterium]|nr:endopeptidase La [Elusimicrobiota bacterium]
MKSSPQERNKSNDILTVGEAADAGAAESALRLPVLPIRDVALFPHMILPVAIGRQKSVKAVEAAINFFKRRLFVVTQKSPQADDPAADDLHEIGTVGEIVQVFKLPDGSVKTFIQGLFRASRLKAAPVTDGWLEAQIAPLEAPPFALNADSQAVIRLLRQSFHQYAQINPNVLKETAGLVATLDDPERLADILAANIALKLDEKQKLLEMTDPAERLDQIYAYLVREIDILNTEKKIQNRVRGQIEKNQREYLLNEQMKAIQKELRHRDDHAKDLDELREQVNKSQMSKEAAEAALKEIGRLEKMMPYSPEATVARTYVDWLVCLPWAKMTADRLEIKEAERILNEDHYGLDKAKERILEYLAVCLLKNKLRGPVLCFTGPPGVGKTSLARSIARALGRNFVRMVVGGMRDEAEIRGHRRTYVGALPGRIIQQIRKAGAKNPVFLIDEIDKMGTDWRGDPAAALLDVLDPEQNSHFSDHYLDVGFDLSNVFFIATANTTFTIPSSLKDRLEIIEFSDYTIREKIGIAWRYLLPKQLKEHGLDGLLGLSLPDEVLTFLIERYTREAGVRNLEREIAALARKIAKETALAAPLRSPWSGAQGPRSAGGAKGASGAEFGPESLAGGQKAPGRETSGKKYIIAGPEELQKYLGAPKYVKSGLAANGLGTAAALAWTEYGGEVLTIEVVRVQGKGNLILTGKLGPTMQESAQAAFTYVRSKADRLALSLEALKTHDFHLHVPEGAVPKDGPSAGAAMAACLAGFLTAKPVKKDLAMTGEITLLGRVLPVGGIRQKLIAAHRHGIKTVLIPLENQKDLDDLPPEVKADVGIKLVSHMDEVIEAALE